MARHQGNSLFRMRRLTLVKRKYASGDGSYGNGILTNSNWIDTILLRRWKTTCETQHGNTCMVAPTAYLLHSIRPIWLIDTWLHCLVLAQPQFSYIALSYVWGHFEFLKALKGNMDQLQINGALSQSEISSQVPQTIKDAMRLVDLLRERYLWVDALCIVQDDEKLKQDQINGMASIFANANLTIIAEQGRNAEFGLRGLRGASRPRNRPQRVFKLENGSEIIETGCFDYKGPSLWSQRGWTYQENVFSRRRLIFDNETVKWKCGCATWTEDHHQAVTLCNFQWSFPDTKNIFSSPFPDLGVYASLVNAYNARQFTYPEDALAGFMGITFALRHTFEGGFLCGIPIMFFDAALLWQPEKLPNRRIPSQSSVPTTCLPSWSWVGWQGKLGLWTFDSACDYIKCSPWTWGSSTTQRTIPITQWYCGTTKLSPRRSIKNFWYNYRKKYLDKTGKTLTGWSRHQNLQGKGQPRWKPPEPQPPSFYYKYSKHKSDPETEFWYPIPLANPLSTPNIGPLEGLLFCRTQRAWLFTSGRPGDKAHPYTELICVRKTDHTWAGVLQLHEPLPPSFESNGVGGLLLCELVAISRGYAYDCSNVIFEWSHKERPNLGDKYEFYNVLWIEWRGDIAYRKALGRIEKHAWEQQELEWIDLTLG
jgi:hypothetical protein